MIPAAASSVPRANSEQPSASTQPSAPARGFFEQKFPVWIILTTLIVVTLPLAGALVWTNSHRLLSLYIWIFSSTHFVLTFTVYLQSENLRYFTATKRNAILFFLIPMGIFGIFYGMSVLRVNPRFPAAGLAFGAVVRLLDFNHFNRQSFGVYQLFKARTGLRPPPVCKKIENAYFLCLTGLLFVTFLAGGISPWIPRGQLTSIAGTAFGAPWAPLPLLRGAAAGIASIAAILLAAGVTILLKAWRAGGRRSGLWESLAYLFFQTLSAALAIAFFPLYAAALAMHYTEYHVLMYPRCFYSRLDPTRTVDHWYQSLRGSRARFYGLLAIVSGLVTFFTTLSASSGGGAPYLAFVAVFDGIFVCHYFIEMLIWKFSDPFFRQTAASLYFAPRSRASSS